VSTPRRIRVSKRNRGHVVLLRGVDVQRRRGPATKPATKAKPATKTATLASAGTFWSGPTADFSRRQEAHITRAKEHIARLTKVQGKRTIENTLKPYDDALLELDAAGAQTSLMQNVHPDSTMRATAEKLLQDVSAYGTELSLDRAVYDAIAAIDLTGADPTTKYYVEKTLRSSSSRASTRTRRRATRSGR
jgi:thimet oligopeptidase